MTFRLQKSTKKKRGGGTVYKQMLINVQLILEIEVNRRAEWEKSI